MSIFLASESPRRRELLSYIVDKFEILSPDTDEYLHDFLSLKPQVTANAFQKAMSALNILEKRGILKARDIIISADTVVYKDRIMLKPATEDEAFEMLSQLSGTWHEVITGLAVIEAYTDNKFLSTSVSRVKFSEMSESEIRTYIATKEPADKAGSYAIQGYGSRFIERIEGDFYSVMGLPLNETYKILKRLKGGANV